MEPSSEQKPKERDEVLWSSPHIPAPAGSTWQAFSQKDQMLHGVWGGSPETLLCVKLREPLAETGKRMFSPIYKQSSLLQASGYTLLPFPHLAQFFSTSAPFSRLRGEVSDSLKIQFVEGPRVKDSSNQDVPSPSLLPPKGLATKSSSENGDLRRT